MIFQFSGGKLDLDQIEQNVKALDVDLRRLSTLQPQPYEGSLASNVCKESLAMVEAIKEIMEKKKRECACGFCYTECGNKGVCYCNRCDMDCWS
jgi:hypothetical protein